MLRKDAPSSSSQAVIIARFTFLSDDAYSNIP
jgi:hypothetical protein